VRRRKAEQREVLRAQVVLAAAQGEENKQIAERLGIAPNTASSGASASSRRAWQGWLTGSGRAGRGPFPPAVIAEVKAIACELPALRAVPLSRFSVADVREEAIACGLVEQVSVSTVGRWLDEDARKPWRHRSWIFPRARTSPPRRGSCSTCTSAGLRASGWGQTSSSSRPTRRPRVLRPLPPPPNRPPAYATAMRVKHEYERGGALAYLVAWDVHRARLFGRCEATTGIAPFGRPAGGGLAEPAAGAPASPRVLVEPGRDLPVDLPAEGHDPERLRRSWRGPAPPARFPAPLRADRGPVCLAFTRADLDRLLHRLAGEERPLRVA
jgi:hypothetical protein